MKIKLRKLLISDTRRCWEIISRLDLNYLPINAPTLQEVKEGIRISKRLRKQRMRFEFAIIANGKHVGCINIVVDKQKPYIGTIGAYIDRKYWGKGICTTAIGLLEEFIVEKMDITRIEMIMAKEQVASQRVVIKSGYKKEGLMKKYMKIGNKFHDCYLYAKIMR
jgi:ribosomal-protein-alanine N-acetyltransferase